MPFSEKKGFLHKNEILSKIIALARKRQVRIVFPESEDERVLRASAIIKLENIADVILLGNRERIAAKAKKLRVSLLGIKILEIEPEKYAKELYKVRKKKGLTIEKARELLRDPMYFATMMLKCGDCEGVISGARHPTAHTFRPALQVIKTVKGIKTASSYFMMIHERQVLFFADCGLNIEPDKNQLADIAISTADTAESFGFKPKVAMLSFSTKGSAKHPLADKVVQATRIVKRRRPELSIDGELQLDVALAKDVASKKAPKSVIKGDANVLIFPDLNSGNIGYKLTQRLAHYLAIGPVSQGIRKPVNDLSRGCSVEDIVELCAITSVQAQR